MIQRIVKVTIWIPLLATSCAHSDRSHTQVVTEKSPAKESSVLRVQAESLWQARKVKNCEVIQTFEDPSTGEDKDHFIAWCEKEDPFRISDFQIGDALIEGDMGWVSVRNTTVYRRKGSETSPVELTEWQKWRKVDGRWLPVPQKLLKSYPESPALRDASEERVLRERFKESWEARKAHDYHRLFLMTDPQDVKGVDEEQFAKAEDMIEFIDYSLYWVQVIGDRGELGVSYYHKLNDPNLSKMPARTLAITEKWIKRDGVWYRDLKNQ